MLDLGGIWSKVRLQKGIWKFLLRKFSVSIRLWKIISISERPKIGISNQILP